MINTDLGRVVLLPAGDWNNTTNYNFLDFVYYNGESFVAKKEVPIGITTGNEEYWQKMTIKNGVQTVEKISTSDLVDTYRMTFSNGGYFDYNVTNGRSLYLNFEVSTTTGDLYVDFLGDD